MAGNTLHWKDRMQPGLFDDEDRLTKLEKLGDPLPRLDSIVVRTKGKVRAAAKIGLMNLTYNMRRLEFLLRPQSAWCAR